MRLFLLPISTRRTLIYCEKATSGTPQSLSDRIINKASTTWTGWEKAESGWQKQLTRYGNQLFRRIPFEEWGLKTLPPLSQQTSTNPSQLKVLYPSLFMQTSKVPVTLDQIATERQGFHRKKLIWSVVAMPFSIPFALVPIVPNIPFFYLAFRAWSHYKALYGARYLKFLIDNKHVDLTPSRTLDEMYAAGLMYDTRAQSREAPKPSEQQVEGIAAWSTANSEDTQDSMLLKSWNGKLLAEQFELPEMEVEIERAVEQVEKSIQAAAELKEEKTNLDEAVAEQEKDKKV